LRAGHVQLDDGLCSSLAVSLNLGHAVVTVLLKYHGFMATN